MVFYVKYRKKSLTDILKNSKKKIKNHRTEIICVCYNDITTNKNVLNFSLFFFLK